MFWNPKKENVNVKDEYGYSLLHYATHVNLLGIDTDTFYASKALDSEKL